MPLTKETQALLDKTYQDIDKSSASKLIIGNSQLLIQDIEDELNSLMNSDGSKCMNPQREIELRNQLRLIQEANTGLKTPKERQHWCIEAANFLRRQVTWGNLGLLVVSVAAAVFFAPVIIAALAFTPLGPIAAIGVAAIAGYLAVKGLMNFCKWCSGKAMDNKETNMNAAQQQLASQLKPMSGTGSPSAINVKSDRAAQADFTHRDFSKGFRQP